jgi:hypothetical protein
MSFMNNWLQYVQNHKSQSHFNEADKSHGINDFRANQTIENTVRSMNEKRETQSQRRNLTENVMMGDDFFQQP